MHEEVGKLTEREHQELLKIKGAISEKLRKIGEFQVLQNRLSNEIVDLEKSGQQIMTSITERLGLSSNNEWVALHDGTIRVLKKDNNTEE